MARLWKYLKEHHNGVVQSLCAVYCAVLTTWERLHPLSQGPVQEAPVQSTMGAFVSGGYLMPWYLWAGIVALSLSVGIPAITKLIRGWRTATEYVAPDWVLNGYQSEQDFIEKEHSIRTLGGYALGVLSTHRLSTVCTAVRLANLHKRFGPRPLHDPRFDWGTDAGRDEGYKEFMNRVTPWETKFHTAYITEFQGPIKSLVYGFGNEGVYDHKLDALLEQYVHVEIADEIARRMTCLALGTEGLQVFPQGQP